MRHTTLSFLGDRFHLLERRDDDLSCPNESTHVRLTPIEPALVSRIVGTAQRDRLMMTHLRHFVARHGSTQRLNWTADYSGTVDQTKPDGKYTPDGANTTADAALTLVSPATGGQDPFDAGLELFEPRFNANLFYDAKP